MADFFPVISRAVAGLKDQTPQARRAIYDRARAVLVTQLQNVSPPIAAAEIARQRDALDGVIARIEAEYTPQPPEAAVQPASERAAPAIPAGAAPSVPVTTLPGPDATEPTPAALSQERPAIPAPSTPSESAAESAKPARPDFASLLRPAEATPPLASTPQPAARPVPSAAERRQPAPADGVATVDRPRLDITIPPPSRAGSRRTLIVVGGVALGLAAVGTAAYYVNRGNREAPPPAVATAQPPAAPGGPKLNERVGGETPSVPPPAPASPAQPGALPRNDVAVAQRAVLYIEPADTTQPPRAVVGRVSWRLEAQNSGQGQLLETVIRADVDIAEVGLQLTVTLRRNTDAAFPASHILGMRFNRTSDDGNGAVREAGVPQFKQEENERGAPLSAITTGLGDNLFVSALSRVPIEVERNLDLIRTRNWIDIPLRFASGKRGIIAFEKGISGDQRIAEGFAAWR